VRGAARGLAWVLAGALAALATHGLARWLNTYEWLRLSDYCCGSEDVWSRNIAVAGWVTGSTAAITAWLACTRSLGLALAGGAAVVGTSIALVPSQAPAQADNLTGSPGRAVLLQIIVGLVGIGVGALAARWRAGFLLVLPIAGLWGLAATSYSLGAHDTPLPLVIGERGYNQLHVIPMYVTVAVTAGAAVVGSRLRTHPGRWFSVAIALVGTGLLVLAFRLADVDMSPDHNTATTPYHYAHRLLIAGTVATVVAVGIAEALSRWRSSRQRASR
jgi:hypothetical protein